MAFKGAVERLYVKSVYQFLRIPKVLGLSFCQQIVYKLKYFYLI